MAETSCNPDVPMNTSILRATLTLSLLLGIGVVANIFGFSVGPSGQKEIAAATPKLVERTLAARNTEAETRDLKLSVRRQLAVRGYLDPDIRYSSVPVRSAILAFEFDHRLPLTAAPSEVLLKALIFTHGKPGGSVIMSPATKYAKVLIEEVQKGLGHLGYLEGSGSGRLDKETRTAIRKFERARGLEESGRISAPLIDSLGPALDVERLQATKDERLAQAG